MSDDLTEPFSSFAKVLRGGVDDVPGKTKVGDFGERAGGECLVGRLIRYEYIRLGQKSAVKGSEAGCNDDSHREIAHCPP
jgi:hypothetical protein